MSKSRFVRHARVALVVLAMALLAACGSAGMAQPGTAAATMPPRAVGANPAPPTTAAGGDGVGVRPGEEGGSGSETGATDGETGTGAAYAAAQVDESLIVRTGSLTMEVADDLNGVLLRARTAISGLGGYVSATQQSGNENSQYASVTYRIPAARWDDALDSLRALGSRVVDEQTDAVEVTGQVLDLGARIENLQASERSLQAIMAQATKIPDVLEVQARLTQVRGEIEQLSTQQAHLEEQAAFGTLAVSYQVPVIVAETAAQGWSLQAELDRAVAQLIELGQVGASILIVLVVVGIPVMLVVGFFIALLVVVARRLGLDRRVTAAPEA